MKLAYLSLLQITDEMSSLVVAQLLFLQSESSKKPIHMYINSGGEYKHFLLDLVNCID